MSEQTVITYLRESLSSVRVFPAVPATRTAHSEPFLTVERVGGAVERFYDTPVWAVAAWAVSRGQAERLAERAVAALKAWPDRAGHVAYVRVNALYHLPDPDTRWERYQATIEAMMKTDHDEGGA
ncbi:MAG: hypothetical protein Q4B10_05925 [Actinomycetaceae bacterium]|nr:hypothetical protein [Actinomycetaceae bacterium]